jgi:predicted Rossmann-fold nucleotide-binding protein
MCVGVVTRGADVAVAVGGGGGSNKERQRAISWRSQPRRVDVRRVVAVLDRQVD